MTRLTALSPAAGLTPLDVAGTTLMETDPGPAMLIAALVPGVTVPGLGWPQPGRLLAARAGGKPGTASAGPGGAGSGTASPSSGPVPDRAQARLLSWGPQEALLLGQELAAPPPGAVMTDQSDAWCHLRLDGALALPALARLVPIDLRETAFPAGSVARSLLGGMPAVIWRDTGPGLRLMVWRSMAAGAVAEIGAALALVAAR